ncbi:hypothetical protein [Nesterenkonia pannonica]|uniref:hypothetical protein n=1 Tax=Nesterenkonia pannonica TaxID=1548602 RepID=UPI002164C33B|nr:hypothetical protein [Nesterenkonia pannonica]
MARLHRLRPRLRGTAAAPLIQREIGDQLAKALLSGAIVDGDTVEVDRNELALQEGSSHGLTVRRADG